MQARFVTKIDSYTDPSQTVKSKHLLTTRQNLPALNQLHSPETKTSSRARAIQPIKQDQPYQPFQLNQCRNTFLPIPVPRAFKYKVARKQTQKKTPPTKNSWKHLRRKIITLRQSSSNLAKNKVGGRAQPLNNIYIYTYIYTYVQRD